MPHPPPSNADGDGSSPAGPALEIVPFPRAEAERAGALLAAIPPWSLYPYPASALATYLATEEPGAPRHALMLDGALAGVMGLRLNWLRGPYVQMLAVLPGFQGRGLGALALARLEAEARGAGERNLWVLASDFNAGALRFYRRHGFAEVAPLPDLVRDGRCEVLLRKRLA